MATVPVSQDAIESKSISSHAPFTTSSSSTVTPRTLAPQPNHRTRSTCLSPLNLFICCFLRSPVACHMIDVDVKAGLTLAQVHRLRSDILACSSVPVRGANEMSSSRVEPAAEASVSPGQRDETNQVAQVNPPQFLRIPYDLEEESSVAPSVVPEAREAEEDTHRS
jgi:hypothetical protein